MIDVRILFPLNIFRTNGHNYIKFYICIDIDKMYVGIVTCHFSQICIIVMVDVRFLFPLNIFRKNGWNLTNMH